MLAAVVITACDTGESAAGTASPTTVTSASVGSVEPSSTTVVASAPAVFSDVEVLERAPHDPTAFTQGLVLADDVVYESTGRYGESTLRAVQPETGVVIRSEPLDAELFGEGLALVGDRLIQLTWLEGVALVYDRDTFELVEQHGYEGEGWGLCFDGEVLYMSDGTSTLSTRDPATFEVIDQVSVADSSGEVELLNELECVEDVVYANVWQTDRIVGIDKATGEVVHDIDASGLLQPSEESELGGGAVLNGIAYDSETDTFLLTGKLWPAMFRVRLVG